MLFLGSSHKSVVLTEKIGINEWPTVSLTQAQPRIKNREAIILIQTHTSNANHVVSVSDGVFQPRLKALDL